MFRLCAVLSSEVQKADEKERDKRAAIGKARMDEATARLKIVTERIEKHSLEMQVAVTNAPKDPPVATSVRPRAWIVLPPHPQPDTRAFPIRMNE